METIRNDYSTGIYYFKDIFKDYNIDIDKDNIDELLRLINDIYYNIPVWGSNGWTMKELLLSEFEI